MQLIYFANPMCSWCWGFAPVIRRLQETWPDLPLAVTTGQLVVGAPGRPLDAAAKESLRGHWEHVAELSGQPFDHAMLRRDDIVYDTAPACRALALVRATFPALAPAFLSRLHERFYALGHDITDSGVLAEAVAEFGIEPDTAATRLEDPALDRAVERDWAISARLGVDGYPTLLAHGDGRTEVITIGYRPFDEIRPALAAIAGRPLETR